MSLAERIDRLEPRERRLLGILGVVVVVLGVVLVPVSVTAYLASQRSDVRELKAAIDDIQAGRAQVERRALEKKQVLERYQKQAPAMASLLEKHANEAKLEIPESQDRAMVPHGKNYEERSTKIVFRKVGMLNLVKFMESVEQSGHPVSISRLNIRKRGTEQDSFDVEMVVSAFDRKEEPKKKKARSGDATESAEGSE
ncbi:MAG TPA: type II secretion system protein GspM [Polyangiaceae bacterium]|nr:type II secretion system protein GspM [Polyangiaceae bacterium]